MVFPRVWNNVLCQKMVRKQKMISETVTLISEIDRLSTLTKSDIFWIMGTARYFSALYWPTQPNLQIISPHDNTIHLQLLFYS